MKIKKENTHTKHKINQTNDYLIHLENEINPFCVSNQKLTLFVAVVVVVENICKK